MLYCNYTWACCRAGPAKSPTPKFATQAWPGCRASFFGPSPAHRAKIVSGRRAGPSLISRFSLPKPGPLLLSGLKSLPRPGPIACFGPTDRAIFRPGRAGPVGPGFPCPAITATDGLCRAVFRTLKDCAMPLSTSDWWSVLSNVTLERYGCKFRY
jgi:hypothetical protein